MCTFEQSLFRTDVSIFKVKIADSGVLQVAIMPSQAKTIQIEYNQNSAITIVINSEKSPSKHFARSVQPHSHSSFYLITMSAKSR